MGARVNILKCAGSILNIYRFFCVEQFSATKRKFGFICAHIYTYTCWVPAFTLYLFIFDVINIDVHKILKIFSVFGWNIPRRISNVAMYLCATATKFRCSILKLKYVYNIHHSPEFTSNLCRFILSSSFLRRTLWSHSKYYKIFFFAQFIVVCEHPEHTRKKVVF